MALVNGGLVDRFIPRLISLTQRFHEQEKDAWAKACLMTVVSRDVNEISLFKMAIDAHIKISSSKIDCLGEDNS